MSFFDTVVDGLKLTGIPVVSNVAAGISAFQNLGEGDLLGAATDGLLAIPVLGNALSVPAKLLKIGGAVEGVQDLFGGGGGGSSGGAPR